MTDHVSKLIQHSIPVLSKKDESEATTDELIFSNLRFVVKMSSKYKAYAPQMDLISGGILGLIKAANKWDRTRNLKFFTYAVHYIKMEMRNVINSNYTIRYSYQKNLKYDYMDDSKKQIDYGEKYKLKTTHTPMEKLIYIETLSKLPIYLNKLTNIEKEVIEHRFLNKKVTLESLSKRLNRTLVGTHLIEKRALQKLKKMIENE